MAHKTLIGGTAYEISGGKTLVNGTAYSIDKGKTLVGGTAYEVGFVELVTVKISQNDMFAPNTDAARVTIDGQVYDGSETVELLLPVGTKIDCYVTASYSANSTTTNIKLNSQTVGTIDSSLKYAEYSYILTGNATIKIGAMNVFGYVGFVDITEE